jgi:hypothetical protein
VSLLAILLLGAPAPLSPTEDQIVVLARKLATTRFVWKASDSSGAWKLTSCKIKKSSGDKEIDALTCQSVADCLHVMPLGAKQAPPEFSACLTERRNSLLGDLAAKRSAAMDSAS